VKRQVSYTLAQIQGEKIKTWVRRSDRDTAQNQVEGEGEDTNAVIYSAWL
jgi:hypothetical protein